MEVEEPQWEYSGDCDTDMYKYEPLYLDNSTCSDCDGVPKGGTLVYDACGVGSIITPLAASGNDVIVIDDDDGEDVNLETKYLGPMAWRSKPHLGRSQNPGSGVGERYLSHWRHSTCYGYGLEIYQTCVLAVPLGKYQAGSKLAILKIDYDEMRTYECMADYDMHKPDCTFRLQLILRQFDPERNPEIFGIPRPDYDPIAMPLCNQIASFESSRSDSVKGDVFDNCRLRVNVGDFEPGHLIDRIECRSQKQRVIITEGLKDDDGKAGPLLFAMEIVARLSLLVVPETPHAQGEKRKRDTPNTAAAAAAAAIDMSAQPIVIIDDEAGQDTTPTEEPKPKRLRQYNRQKTHTARKRSCREFDLVRWKLHGKHPNMMLSNNERTVSCIDVDRFLFVQADPGLAEDSGLHVFRLRVDRCDIDSDDEPIGVGIGFTPKGSSMIGSGWAWRSYGRWFGKTIGDDEARASIEAMTNHTYTTGDEVQVEIDRHHGRTLVTYQLFKGSDGVAVFETPIKLELALRDGQQWKVLYFSCTLLMSQVTLIPPHP